MSTITKIDGVKYVERNYKCIDCDWSWSQVTTEGAPMQGCPECHNVKTRDFTVLPDHATVKSKKKIGPKLPASKKKEKWNPAGGKAPSYSNGFMKKAAAYAFEEAQKQGATDMIDSGLREGDISAPPINNAVTHAMEKGFGMKNGWTGNEVPMNAVPSAGDNAGATAMRELQQGLQSNQLPDMLRSNLVHAPKEKR